jgi:hypothetical protein
MQNTHTTLFETGWLPLAYRLHYLSASRQVERQTKSERKEKSDESQNEHQGRQRTVGQLISSLIERVKIPGKGEIR